MTLILDVRFARSYHDSISHHMSFIFIAKEEVGVSGPSLRKDSVPFERLIPGLVQHGAFA